MPLTCCRSSCLTALLLAALAPAGAQADSPWLYGIHWASSPVDDDLETMTGGKPVWVVDQALLDSTATVAAPNEWETPWVTHPRVYKTAEAAKPPYFRSITDRGHSIICRLGPQWGVSSPYPGDPYTVALYAEDCKAAANLMKNVRVWQIGNEGNLKLEQKRWNAATQSYSLDWPDEDLAQAPELYAATYVACRDKIHEVTPATTPATQIVLMMPMSPGKANAEHGRFMDSNEFLARMIAAVTDKSKIDGFALHSYAQPGGSSFGADSFMDDLRQQLMIIDQAGLGDRPVFITEFNKHMPNATEAQIGARFCTTAFEMLNAWNTGESQVWPGRPNHPIRGAAWFVYRGGAGWDDYSLRHWKDQIGSTLPTENPWYAFQSAAAENYAAGTGSGPGLTTSNEWWRDDFNGATLDQTAPLPFWLSETGEPGAQVSMTGSGAVRLSGGTSNYGNASIRTPDTFPFTDFKVVAEVTFTDAGRNAEAEANFDLRLREGDGTGYSLTFYSSQSAGPHASLAGQVHLRKTGVWSVYRSASIPGGINTGDRFRIEAVCQGSDLSFRVTRLSNDTVVLDWTGSNKFTNTERRLGNVRLMVYNMREAQVDSFVMGGPEASLLPTAATGWKQFE